VLEVNRQSKTPVSEQLVEQLRYLIASGHYAVNDTLPSTRKLGERLGVSFHTVRKAYKTLAEEGLLESQVGSGYTVLERAPLEKSERMERGAEIVNDALQRLIGLGLSDSEVEYLVQEQASLLDHSSIERKLILVGAQPETNALCAEQLTDALQQTVRPVPFSRLGKHEDADFVFAPYGRLPQVIRSLPRADVMGYATHLPARILEQVARLRDQETLGLITRYRDTIPALSGDLREHTAYGGQVIAASIEEGTEHLEGFVDQTDLLLYTPESRRRLLPVLDDDAPPHEEVRVRITQDGVDAIVEAVPA
jgi:GntR family transcriptional regulator